MSSSKSKPLPEPVLKPAPSNASPNSDKNQSKYEAAVLLREAKTQGWSEEKLTKALSDNPAKSQPSADTSSAPPAQVESEGQSRDTDSKRAGDLKRRQETIRIIRQAEMEGWGDERLVVALRTRLEIQRQEVRERAKSL